METIKKAGAKRWIASFLLISFTISNTAWAGPSSGAFQVVTSGAAVDGVRVPSFVRDVLIPESLGVAAERHQAEASDGLSVIHLQDAHASFQAQQSIAKLLDYLAREYGVDMIFVEGAVNSLERKNLQFLADKKANTALIELLAKEGVISGAELYLLKNKSPLVEELGVENQELYRGNLKSFREVYAYKNQTEAYLDSVKVQIATLASRVFNKTLKTFFHEWVFYQDNQDLLMRHLETLTVYAQKQLQIDLSDARQQLNWPALVRYNKLHAAEGTLQFDQAQSELKKLLRWLVENNTVEVYREALSHYDVRKGFETMKMSSETQAFFQKGLRYFMEGFYDQVREKGFDFNAYPELSKAWGMAVLREELDAGCIYEEVQKLTDLLLEKMAPMADEKELLLVYRDYLSLVKMLKLEMTYQDEEAMRAKKASVRPDALELRIAALQKDKSPGQLKTDSKILQQAEQAFDTAIAFYDQARARDTVIFNNMMKQMKKRGGHTAVLITGGFHTQGIAEQMKKNHVSYVEVTPHISEIGDNKAYVNAMTLKGTRNPKASTVPFVRLADGGMSAWSARGFDGEARYFGGRLVGALRTLAFSAAILAGLNKEVVGQIPEFGDDLRSMGIQVTNEELQRELKSMEEYKDDFIRPIVVTKSMETSTQRRKVDLIDERRRRPGMAPQAGSDIDIPTLLLEPHFDLVAEMRGILHRIKTLFHRDFSVQRVEKMKALRSEVRAASQKKEMKETLRQETKLISNGFKDNLIARMVLWMLTPLSSGFRMIANLFQASPKRRAGYNQRYNGSARAYIQNLEPRVVLDSELSEVIQETTLVGPVVAGSQAKPRFALSDPRSGASNGITGGDQAHGVYTYQSPVSSLGAEGEASGGQLENYLVSISYTSSRPATTELRVYESLPVLTSRIIYTMPMSVDEENVVFAVRAGGFDYLIIDRGNHSQQVDVIADFMGTAFTHHFDSDVHVTGIRALQNGDLEIRTTSADQKDNVVRVLRNNQIISTTRTPFAMVSAQTQGTLTPLLLQQIPQVSTGAPARLWTNLVGPKDDIISQETKLLSVTKENVRALAAGKDEGFQIIMGQGTASGYTPATPRLFNQLDSLTLSLEAARQSQKPGQAIDAPIPVRVELVGREEYRLPGYQYPLYRETADSVVVMVRPGQKFAEIPVSAFSHYDFSIPVKLISIINADEMPVELSMSIANYPIPQISLQSTSLHPEPGAPVQLSGTVQNFDAARQKMQIFEGNTLLADNVAVANGSFARDLNLAAGTHTIRIKVTDIQNGWEVSTFNTVISVAPIAGSLQPLPAGTALNGLSGNRSLLYDFNLVSSARQGAGDSFVMEFGGGITPKTPLLAADFGGQLVIGIDQTPDFGRTVPSSIRINVSGVSQSGAALPAQDFVIKSLDATPGAQVYSIPFGAFAKITQITLLPDFGANNALSPHLTVKLNDTAVQEFRAVSTDKTVADISLPKDGSGKAPSINMIASTGVTQTTDLTATGVHTSFNSTSYGNYLVQQYRYDTVSDWSQVAEIRVGALKTLQRNDTTPNEVRLEVKDINGKTATISYQDFTLGREHILSLPVNTIAAVAARQKQTGFDITKVASIAVVHVFKGAQSGIADLDIDAVQAGAVITPSLDFYNSDINAAASASLLTMNLIGDARIGLNGHDAVTVTRDGGFTYTTPLTQEQLNADGTGYYIFSLDATASGSAIVTLSNLAVAGKQTYQTFVLRGIDNLAGSQLFALPISAALPNLAHVEIRSLNAPKAGEQPTGYTLTLRAEDLEFSSPDKHLFYAENIAVPSINTSSFQTVAPASPDGPLSYQGYVTPLGSRGEFLDGTKNIAWFVHGINYDNTSTTQPGIQTADWSQVGQVRFYLKTSETSAKIEVKDSLGGKAVIRFNNLIPGAWQPIEIDTAALREISAIQQTPLTLSKIHTLFTVTEFLQRGRQHFVELATRPSQSPNDTTLVKTVSPISALVIINLLNDPNAMAALSPSARLVYDANRDGSISPIDALVIINELNRRSGAVTAEGEAAFEDLSGIRPSDVAYRRDGNSTVISTPQLTHTVTPRGEGEAPEIRTTLTVPQGWIRAASNPSFAFREYSKNGATVLQLLDLRNHEIKNLALQQTSTVIGQASTFFSHLYDVSPDNYPGGPVVVYQTGSLSYRGTATYTKVQRVTGNQVLMAQTYLTMNPALDHVVFGANGQITLTHLNEQYHVKTQQTVTVTASGITEPQLPITQVPMQLINQNSSVHVGTNARVAVVNLSRTGNGDGYEIAIFDTSRGLQNMRYVRQVRITADSNAVFKYVNSYVSLSGRKVIAVGLDADHANHTLFVDVVSGKTLKLPINSAQLSKSAAIISQQGRRGDVVTFNALNQDRSTRTIAVNLKTLTFVKPRIARSAAPQTLAQYQAGVDALLSGPLDLLDDVSLRSPLKRAEVREINSRLVHIYGRSLPAVVAASRVAYATVDEQLPRELIVKLVDLVAPKVSEQMQISQADIRAALMRRIDELRGLEAVQRLVLDAEGSVILSADHLDKRKNVLLAMIPFMVQLASAERRQSFFFAGAEAKDLKQFVLNAQTSGLTPTEMSQVSRIFSFAAAYDPEKDLREHIRQERKRGVSLTASISPEVSKIYAGALESILRNIEAPAEFSKLKTADQVAAAAEAFAVRAYMLLNLAKYLKAELTKKQGEPIKVLIAQFFNNLGITVENINADGSFALSLQSVSQYLSALKEAQAALGKSA